MKFFRNIFLFPFSLIYGSIIYLRNWAYENGHFKSIHFDIPTICIGNLSLGGTGKTPHTEYLISLLKPYFPLSVLSRGYGRKSSGYIEVLPNSSATSVGDEPLFYKWKHPDVKVAVCEDRTIGIPYLVAANKMVVLLDDAFQHRSVRAGISILLTEFDKPYFNDQLVPMGSLREFKSGARRADLIVISKCPENLSKNEREWFKEKIDLQDYQYLFFSYLNYGNIYGVFEKTVLEKTSHYTALMVTGIAKPEHMLEHLEGTFAKVYQRSFSDHHNYSKNDIESIITTYKNLPNKNKIIVTTEKDITKLVQFKTIFVRVDIPIFCLPVKVQFFEEDRSKFHKAIQLYIEKSWEQPS